MFTGLIEAICTVKSARRIADGMVLTMALGKLADGTNTGDSIAINGVCLTVTRLAGGLADFDVSAETLAKSTLGNLRPLSQVNVERAMKATDRFGGHIVQGHIDGTATIKAIDRHGEFADIRFATGAELLDQMAVKGSVAVDGISLTVANMDESSFGVAIIPETLKKTTLGSAKVGNVVNLETDIIVKVIKKQLERILPQDRLTIEKLKQLGF